MARKKLFGNASEPRCETCLHGKRSSEGDSILCQRGGVLPLSHHCRHFQYDPLRRTPKRIRPLEEFNAAEFALDDLSAEWLESVAQEEQPSPDDVQHKELMQKLRSYLAETSSPNVDDILLLLNETPVSPVDTEALLAEADALLGTETSVASSLPIDEDELLSLDAEEQKEEREEEEYQEESESIPEPDIQEEAAPEPDPEPAEESPSVWHADASLDIVGDLESLTVDVVQSSTSAAFRNFDLKLTSDNAPAEERDDIEIADSFSDTALLTMSPAGDLGDDAETLRAEDLIFLSASQLGEERGDSLEMNEDGTFTQFKE